MNNIKRLFLFILISITFVWFAYSLIEFYMDTLIWADMQITNKQYVNEFLNLCLKNILTLLGFLTFKKYYY